jgi:hypothetical protein
VQKTPFLEFERSTRGRYWVRITGPQNHVLPERSEFTKEFRTWSNLFDRWHYPYGLWITASGAEVLFNREYRPIFWRWPGQPGQPALPVWVPDIVDTIMLLDIRPWRGGLLRPAAARELEVVIDRFKRGLSITAFLRQPLKALAA